MFKKTILISLLATAGLSVFAADYYVVVPLQGKQELLNGISVSLNNTPLPAGVVGVPYQGFDLAQALQVTGDPAYRSTNVGWSVVAGALPAGLALTKGVITGTPTAAGEQSFSVRAAYKTKTGEQAYKILTFAVTVALATATLPQGLVGLAYPTYDLKPLLTVSGDPGYTGANVTWSVVSNTLPAGLTLKADGTIAGTPTAARSGAVTARASYRGVNGQQTYQIVTLAITVGLASGTLPQGVVGVTYPTQDLKSLLTVAGDPSFSPANVTWTVVSSTLPAGLTLKTDGTISGTPTAASTGSVTARASYKGITGEQTYQVITLQMTVNLVAATLPEAVVGLVYAGADLKTFLSVPSDPGFNAGLATFALTSGTLPAGLTLSAAGVLSGTPTAATAGAPIQVTASYKTVTGAQAYQVIVVKLNVSLASAALPVGLLGVAYNAGSGFDFKSVLSAPADPGFNASLATFALTSGTLPAGLNLSSSGVLTGTPTQLTVNAGVDLTVSTTYKGNLAQQAFKVPVRGFASCDAVLAAKPGSPSGNYYLDFDGAGPGGPAQYYCDMTPEGEGWLRLDATNATFSAAVSAQGEVIKAFIPENNGCFGGKTQFSVSNFIAPVTKLRMDLTRSTVSQCSYLANLSAGGTSVKYWNGSTYQPLGSSCAWNEPNWAGGNSSIAGLPAKYQFFGNIPTSPASNTVSYTGACNTVDDTGIYSATVFVR